MVASSVICGDGVCSAVVQPLNTPRISALLRAGAAADAMGAQVEFFGHCAEGFFKKHEDGVRWPACLTGVHDALSLATGSQTSALMVTDDTIMTELTLKEIQTWGFLPEGERTFERLMDTIAKATLANYEVRDTEGSYSWADGRRAPGAQCIKAIKEYAQGRCWDRSLAKRRAVGFEGGSGKVMDSAPFGCAFKEATVAAHGAQMHSKISHPDVVSQAACAAFAYGISSALYTNKPLGDLIAGMKQIATAVSAANRVAEGREWRAAKAYWPCWRHNNSSRPYTVAERIADVERDVERKVVLEKILQKHGGWGAPDLIAAVVGTALWAELKGWTVKEAVLAVINADSLPGGIDRDTVASAAAHFLAARGLPLGFSEEELCLIERDESRRAVDYGGGLDAAVSD